MYRQLKCSLKSNANHLDNPNGDATYFNLIKGQCISSLAHLECFPFWTKQEINLKAYSVISWFQWGRTNFLFLHLFVAYLHVDNYYPPKKSKIVSLWSITAFVTFNLILSDNFMQHGLWSNIHAHKHKIVTNWNFGKKLMNLFDKRITENPL